MQQQARCLQFDQLKDSHEGKKLTNRQGSEGSYSVAIIQLQQANYQFLLTPKASNNTTMSRLQQLADQNSAPFSASKNPHAETTNSHEGNSLRYSALEASNNVEHARTSGIICSRNSRSGVYNCQICAGLRQVCPFNLQATATRNNRVFSFVEQTHTEANRNTAKFESQNEKREKIKITEYLGKKIFNSEDRGGQKIEASQDKTPNSQRKRILSNVEFTRSYYNQPPRVETAATGVNLPSLSTQLVIAPNRVIEEIVYVPYVHNIIKPQFEFINPQEGSSSKSRSRHRGSHRLVSHDLNQTPRRNKTTLSKNGIPSPEDLKRFVESVYRY